MRNFFSCIFVFSTLSFPLINGASVDSSHPRNLLGKQSTVTFPATCEIECEALEQNCGSNQCGCSVDIQDTLDTCQACVLEEKGHEATEAALNSASGTSSTTDTDNTSSVTVPSISQYQQFCANAGSPITGSPQASNSQLSKGSTGGNVADTAASSPNSVSSGNGNGDAGSPQSKTSDGVPKVVVDIWCVVLLGIVTPYVLA